MIKLILSMNTNTNNEDFTTKHYEKLLKIASFNYQFISYKAIP